MAIAQPRRAARVATAAPRSTLNDIADLLFAVEPDNVDNVKNLYFENEIPGKGNAGESAKGESA